MAHAVEEKKEASLFWILLYWVSFPLIGAKLSIILLPLVIVYLFIPPKSSEFYTGGDPSVTSKLLAQ